MSESPRRRRGPPVVLLRRRRQQRRLVALRFGATALEIVDEDETLASWPYDEIRRVESPGFVLRRETRGGAASSRGSNCAIARLHNEILARCRFLDGWSRPRVSTRRIVDWSLAATASVVALIWFGIPFAADRHRAARAGLLRAAARRGGRQRNCARSSPPELPARARPAAPRSRTCRSGCSRAARLQDPATDRGARLARPECARSARRQNLCVRRAAQKSAASPSRL